MAFLSEPLSLLLLCGLALKCAGFVLRDELLLRLFVAAGICMDIAFYALQPVPIAQSIIVNSVLVAVNVVLIGIILFERTTWRMSDEDRSLFAHFPTLTPGQFRRVMRTAEGTIPEAATDLIAEGAAVNKLFLVFAETYEIEKRGRVYAARGPAFVGEIAFLTGAASSAGVRVPAGSRVVSFDSAALHKLMARKPAIHNGMVALFGRDLAAKVAASVPIPQADAAG
ncbi:MAG: Cyclic nucleotide-binding domain [Rhodobacteraceae bacterium HLUCCA08]|nr:MAG: Cyclic nucleotide-binding domain [Rhodobacteraceae bacterium HLUCCA08]